MQPSKWMVVLVVCVLSSVAHGEVYSWKDADGQMHYSDTPPTGNVETRTLGTPAASDPGARRGLAERNMDFRKRQSDKSDAQAKAEKSKSDEEDRKKNCEQAQNQVRLLESGQRMMDVDAKGERVVLDDEGRAKALADSRKAVDAWCK